MKNELASQERISQLLQEAWSSQIISQIKSWWDRSAEAIKQKLMPVYNKAKNITDLNGAYNALVRDGVIEEDEKSKGILQKLYRKLGIALEDEVATEDVAMQEGVSHGIGMSLTIAGYLFMIGHIIKTWIDVSGMGHHGAITTISILSFLAVTSGVIPILAKISLQWERDKYRRSLR